HARQGDEGDRRARLQTGCFRTQPARRAGLRGRTGVRQPQSVLHHQCAERRIVGMPRTRLRPADPPLRFVLAKAAGRTARPGIARASRRPDPRAADVRAHGADPPPGREQDQVRAHPLGGGRSGRRFSLRVRGRPRRRLRHHRTPDPARAPAHRLHLGRRGASFQPGALQGLRERVEGLRDSARQETDRARRLFVRGRFPRGAQVVGAEIASDRDLRIERRNRRRRAGGGEVRRHRSAGRTVDRRFRGQPVLQAVVAGADHRAPGHGSHCAPRRAVAAGATRRTSRTRSRQRRLQPGTRDPRLDRTAADAAMNARSPAHAESTRMFAEAGEAADAIARQLEENRHAIASLAQWLRAHPPRFIATCARGSSDHAATYGQYLFETQLGLVTASASPSIASVYAVKPKLQDALFIAISQSGRSPDLLLSTDLARAAGARVVVLVNDESAPLAQLAHHVIPLRAGRETSVAATKSYLCSLAALLQLTASWSGNEALSSALHALPQALRQAWSMDWSPLIAGLRDARDLFVVGRGLGLAAAQEAALKLKETCGLHAEAFSSAEVMHGPMAIVGAGFPVL